MSAQTHGVVSICGLMLIEGPGFELARVPIPAQLTRFIASWVGYREASRVPVERIEYPVGRAVLIFEFGVPIQLGESGGLPTQFRTGFFAGIDERPTVTRFLGEQAGIEVNLTPEGAFALTRGAVAELRGAPVESAELGFDKDLCSRLAESKRWDERFRLVAEELTRRVQGSRQLSALVRRAMSLIDETGGGLQIYDLSQTLGASRKYVHERFVAETGFAPKRYAALRRFARVKTLLATSASGSLASVALRAGYADQSHMTREVRRFAATTPAGLALLLKQPIALEVQYLFSEDGGSSLGPA